MSSDSSDHRLAIDQAATAKVEAVAIRNTYWLTILQWGVGIFVGVVAGAWAARGVMADFDRRLSIVEVRQSDFETRYADALNEIRQDLRDLRASGGSKQ